ncbi:hypothetical protein [Winogradskya humida]|uniref:Uncharacterized protein n=1 Tax=Winogradskya humida TaxID=113566 RepID=A0ABQ3ZUP5_9ACTN|nr:hypothetical protein [Actinoplanes humidus]GIE22330.1 hypothetical protein Ahu01nite_054320 [Actinoplanes humidus]
MGAPIVGALIVAALAAALIGLRYARRDGDPAASPSPSPSTASAAQLMAAGEGVYTVTSNPQTKDFVVQAVLKNPGSAALQISAGRLDEPPGISRWTMAVLPDGLSQDELTYEAVTKAASTHTILESGQSVQLTIAGTITCGAPMISHAEVPILVDHNDVSVTMPHAADAPDWLTEVSTTLC